MFLDLPGLELLWISIIDKIQEVFRPAKEQLASIEKRVSQNESNIETIEGALAEKASHADITDLQNNKADVSAVESIQNSLSSKANQSDLASKLDITAFNTYVENTTAELTGKADAASLEEITANIQEQLAGKASTSVATTSTNGLMSSTDKSKLDGIATGANKTTVDSALSSSSANPLQNKVIYTQLNKKATTSALSALDERVEALEESPGGALVAVTTSGSANAYTATVSGLTVEAGACFIMIPHVVSSSTTCTLAVNGGTAAPIKRLLGTTSVVKDGDDKTWIAANVPRLVIFDGTNWIIQDISKPSAADLAAGTFEGKMVANATATKTLTNSQVRNIYAGTEDMTAGTSTLTAGAIYIVYEA